MTVTLYSITPPTSHASRYLLRPTVLVAPPTPVGYHDETTAAMLDDIDTIEVKAKRTDEPLAEDDLKITLHWGGPLVVPDDTVLDDIDSMYDRSTEDPVGLLEKSAEITRFP